jgi:hypothetical protein
MNLLWVEPSCFRSFLRAGFSNHMKQFTKLTALLAVGAIAPAIAAPSLVSSARAQDATATSPTGNAGSAVNTSGQREFQDVPTGHWAYPALQKLAAAGILEGYPPTGNFIGQRPMTRYEFAVAIARLLNRIPNAGNEFDPTSLSARITTLEGRPIPDVTRQQVQDLIDALRREFQDEIARINGRLDVLDTRVGALENRVSAPNRLTTAVSILHRRGYANYINDGIAGRTFLRPDIVGTGGDGFNAANDTIGTLPNYPTANDVSSYDRRVVRRTFSYTDLEVRLQDRVSDRLSVNAALRSLGDTQEDPWAGNSNGGLYIREAFVAANVGNKIGLNNIQATLGRQRTKIALGLLYDNDLSPTDQLRYDANLGPIAFTGFFGSQNNSGIGSGFGFNGGANRSNPYLNQGSEFYLNPVGPGAGAFRRIIGFGTTTGGFADDNETLLRGGLNLFRISGQPVQLAYSNLLDGFKSQAGESVDLTLPLFNRTIGLELVRNRKFEDTTRPGDSPIAGGTGAGIVSLNVLRTSILDLNAAYGRAGNKFEFFGASSANPYARTYGEALFDRPIFLGAPLINGDAAANPGEPQFLTAKEGFDFNGTVRLPISFLRRVPLDFRYYTAKSGSFDDGTGTGTNIRRRLGEVYSVGTRFNLTPGVDLEVKGGFYNPRGDSRNINYVRIGASVGF